MLTVLALVGALAVLFVAAVVATRGGEVLREAPRDGADLDLPTGPLQAEDVAEVRLGLAVRGYRMAEVDGLLERVSADLAGRDARIRELEAALLVARKADPAAGGTAGGIGRDLSPAAAPGSATCLSTSTSDPSTSDPSASDPSASDRSTSDRSTSDAAPPALPNDCPDPDPDPDPDPNPDAGQAEPTRRSRQAAEVLEQQAVIAPPLAGRGRFLGVRVRTDATTQAQVAEETGLEQPGTPAPDTPAPGTPAPVTPGAGPDGSRPREERHRDQDPVGGDHQRP